MHIGRRPGEEHIEARDGEQAVDASAAHNNAEPVPDYVAADPARIKRALAYAQGLNTGGWYVLGASDSYDRVPRAATVDGRSLVVYRDDQGLRVAPESCPHMGASLACARQEKGALICPWHGLRLGVQGHGAWRHYPAHDDGVLAWVQLPSSAATDVPTDAPILAPRPRDALVAVIVEPARCEARDVIANRLDPWHGAHYHPHSFGALRVLDERPERLLVRVSYRVAGPISVEVDATFHCPDARTITMTIVAGEGRDSVVETHATPTGPGTCAVIEATMATSERVGFQRMLRLTRMLAPLGGGSMIRRSMEARARRLWIEDVAYAERLYALRARQR